MRSSRRRAYPRSRWSIARFQRKRSASFHRARRAKQRRADPGSKKACDVGRDHRRVGLEGLEGGGEREVSVVDGSVEAVVGGRLLGDLPDALDAVEFGGVCGQPKQLEAMTMLGQPSLSDCVELVAGSVVDDEEDFATRATTHHLLEEVEKRSAVEDLRELVDEVRAAFDRDRAEHVRGLALTEGVDAWLDTYSRPRDVERSVEPEARLVSEHHDAAAGSRFFWSQGGAPEASTAGPLHLRGRVACAVAERRSRADGEVAERDDCGSERRNAARSRRRSLARTTHRTGSQRPAAPLRRSPSARRARLPTTSAPAPAPCRSADPRRPAPRTTATIGSPSPASRRARRRAPQRGDPRCNRASHALDAMRLGRHGSLLWQRTPGAAPAPLPPVVPG